MEHIRTLHEFLDDTKNLPPFVAMRKSIEVRQGNRTLYKTLLNEDEKYFEMVDRVKAQYPGNPDLYGFDFDGDSGLVVILR